MIHARIKQKQTHSISTNPENQKNNHMLFNKYQYRVEDVVKRGYSQSAGAFGEDGKFYWVKWILGVSQSDTSLRLLSDKLRHLQQARHSVLPEMVEYGFDAKQGAFAIVFEYLNKVETLQDKIKSLSPMDLMPGMLDVVDCLKVLHEKHHISHGDIHPGNILIDGNGQFYVVDFGLAVLTRTLSEEKELVVFAREFAAPEKFGKVSVGGFPFQSDVYSIGRILDWAFRSLRISLSESAGQKIQRLMADLPADRPNWLLVAEMLRALANESVHALVQVAFRQKEHQETIIELLRDEIPRFDVIPGEGKNFQMDIVLGDVLCEKVLWIKEEDKLLFNGMNWGQTDEDKKRIDRKKTWGKRLPFSVHYATSIPGNKTDLTPFFQQWLEQNQKQSGYRKGKKAFQKELEFYRQLLEKELEEIRKKSLRLQYSSIKIEDDELIFQLAEKEAYSSKGSIQQHVDIGNTVNSEGFEYELSNHSDRKQIKNPIRFTGKPYDYDSEKKTLKIKDLERFKEDEVPLAGYLFENTSKKEEEKKRQLDALRRVEKNEVLSMDLMVALFDPENISSKYLELPTEVETVYQKNENGQPFQYTPNQTQAIVNALHRNPLTIIQGPPGTGKTTVITEIVFQLLHARPESKILITSQTNNAVDQVLEGLLQNQIPVLRLNGIRSPNSPIIAEQTLDRKLEGWKKAIRKRATENFKTQTQNLEKLVSAKAPLAWNFVSIILKEQNWSKAKTQIELFAKKVPSLKGLHQLPEDKKEGLIAIEKAFNVSISEYFNLFKIHNDWVSTVSALDEKSPLNLRLVDSIRVVGATCNHIASKRYSKFNFEFDYVIMDEAGKATPAEALVPIIMGKNLLMVGDHRQLRPMITQNREVESWLKNKYKTEALDIIEQEDYFNKPSLFESVIEAVDPDYKTQLTECRRLPAEAVELTSRCFYQDFGDDPIRSAGRDSAKEHNLDLAISSSLFFIDIGNDHKNEVDNTSSYNSVSLGVVTQLLEYLDACGPVKEYTIGVIAGYSAQRRRLIQQVDRLKSKGLIPHIASRKKKEDRLVVSVVDQFQGLEKDIVIMDLVKSGPRLDLGFLETPNRINVALSRHKRLLFLVGDFQGLIQAKTRRNGGEKVALQKYLELIPKSCILKKEQLIGLFKK